MAKIFKAEIDSDELTLRIAEACLGMKRPSDLSAKDALARQVVSRVAITVNITTTRQT